MSGTVCVFAKPPVAGLSKTRLARGVGAEAAARLAGAFLTDTLGLVAQGLPGARTELATTDLGGDFGVLPSGLTVVDQGGGDLGARVERVLRAALDRGQWAIALGADSPGLPAERLVDAVAALKAGRAVLGPSEDGGFYLLGLARCPVGLLAGIPWSSPRTATATEAALVRGGLDPVRLETWFDVDEAADLERFRSQVPRVRAPATWAVLDRGLAR